jgi:hypothetical protein
MIWHGLGCRGNFFHVRVWESAHITYNTSTSVFDGACCSGMARMSLISTPFSSSARRSVFLQGNQITALGNSSFAGFHRGQTLRVYLQNNMIDQVGAQAFAGFNGTFCFVFMHDNDVTSLASSAFAGFNGGHLCVVGPFILVFCCCVGDAVGCDGEGERSWWWWWW